MLLPSTSRSFEATTRLAFGSAEKIPKKAPKPFTRITTSHAGAKKTAEGSPKRTQHSPCLGCASNETAGSEPLESGTMKPGQGANLSPRCQFHSLS